MRTFSIILLVFGGLYAGFCIGRIVEKNKIYLADTITYESNLDEAYNIGYQTGLIDCKE